MGAVAALGIAATVAALRPSGEPRPARPASGQEAIAASRSEVSDDAPEPLPSCTTPQLELELDVLGGSPTLVLRHARGRPCRLARTPVAVTITDRGGKPVRLSTRERSVQADFSPDFERLLGMTFLPSCSSRGPYTAVATVGPYTARGTLSAREVGCFRGG